MLRLNLFLLCAGLAQAQVITTIAGTDVVFPVGGVSAPLAPLRAPSGMVFDSAGNLYISDYFANIVARVTPGGTLTVIAGNSRSGFSGDGGPAIAASLSRPVSLAVDSGGNLFIADSGNDRIRKVSGGIITTVAGNGSEGYSGDGGPATRAALSAPLGVAFDTAGNLYIADTGNNRIRKISGGTINTVAGGADVSVLGDGGPANQASILFPYSVAVDTAGNLYIAEYFRSRIRKVSAGTINTLAGNGTLGYGGDGGPAANAMINQPNSVALDAAGNLYLSEAGGQRVRKVAGGIITTVAGNGTQGYSGDGGPATNAKINLPYGVTLDPAGNLYIGDFENGRVRKVSGGIISTFAGNGNGTFAGDGGSAITALFKQPIGVANDTAGNLYIADYGNHRIRMISRSTGVVTTVAGTGLPDFSGDGGPALKATLNFPTSVALDSAGNLYIADSGNNRVRKVSGGIITTFAGNGNSAGLGDSGPAVNAGLALPYGVALDTAGSLYIADSGNNRIRKVSGGIISTVAGNGLFGGEGDGGTATSASLFFPTGVAVDAAGSLYIADSFNSRVRKVTGGIIRTVAGSGTRGFAGEGGSATLAQLNLPMSVAVDPAGNLYISDSGNDRVRKVSGGLITTVAGNNVEGFSGDGGEATSASLYYPQALSFDSAGNLYIADANNNRIRTVLANKPSYQAAPQTLSFSGTAGGAASSGQAIALSSTTPGVAYTTSVDANWLTVSPSTGIVPAALVVTANPGALSAGTYRGNVTITVPNASPSIRSVAVTFTVQAATPASLAVDSQSLSFAVIQGSSAVTQTLQVLNTGGGSVTYSASAATSTGGSWLSISPASGTATAASPASLTVTATPGSLSAGTYSGTITITGGGKSVAILATLSVSAPTAAILLSQTALTFDTIFQGGAPLPGSFAILNTGQGAMSWTAEATTLSGDNWLEVSPASGRVERPYLDTSPVNVLVNPRSLSQGTYYGRIQVAAAAGNTPQVITVVLNVLPAGSTLGPQVFPAGLIFTGTAGQSPGSQDVQVANRSANSIDYVSSVTGASLDYLPKSSAVQPNQPATIRVYPDFSRLAPGSTQQSMITLQFSDSSPAQTINVLSVVAPAAASANGASLEAEASVEPRASSCDTVGPRVVFRSPQPSQTKFNAVAGQATTLEVQVSDGCGNLVGPAQKSARVTASFSDRSSLSMVPAGGGVWQASWRPVNPGTLIMFVTAFVPNPSDAVLGGQSPTLTAVVSAPGSAPAPTVTAQGVVHAASDQGGVPIAPGGLITIYGQNLADGVGQSSGLPLPDQLNGTQVLLGNQTLPILYTNPAQLNVQVPYGVPVNTQYQLTVRRGSTYSAPQSLVVAQAQPGIFTVNQQGSGQGSIVKSDGVTLAQRGTPANIGETIVIYATGLGVVTPKVREGAPPGSEPPLSTTDSPVTVTIGGRTATVIFSGLTPGIPGLYQINAVVPEGIQTGDEVPVVVSVAGQTSPASPAVTIAVR